ncbi:MAG: DUF1579 family protein [Caldilineaceae bacterium]
MSVLDKLAACAGEWQGVNTLQDPFTAQAEDSPATAMVTPLLGGKFIRIDYTWHYQAHPQAGSLLVGYQADAGLVTAHWIDTWHMGDKVMACQGAATLGEELNLRGVFAVENGPDWGWRIILTPVSEQDLRIVMYNISPTDEEDLAVTTVLRRGA